MTCSLVGIQNLLKKCWRKSRTIQLGEKIVILLSYFIGNSNITTIMSKFHTIKGKTWPMLAFTNMAKITRNTCSCIRWSINNKLAHKSKSEIHIALIDSSISLCYLKLIQPFNWWHVNSPLPLCIDGRYKKKNIA